ncbi:MAG: DUF4349 domain-containing protein [Acidimicrobiales bacterium]
MARSAALLAAGVLVAGCSGGSKERFETVGARIDGGEASTGAGSSADDRATEVTIVPAGQPVEGRQVTYRATLVVRVADATDAAAEAQSIADDAGGYLARSDASLDDDRQVALTLRLPSAAFDGALDDLAALGDVRERSIDSDDVTDEVVDLRGRLENAQASAQRIRELLAKAEQVQNLIALEDRLTERQTEIEALEGQLAQLDDRVELATAIDLCHRAPRPRSPTTCPGGEGAAGGRRGGGQHRPGAPRGRGLPRALRTVPAPRRVAGPALGEAASGPGGRAAGGRGGASRPAPAPAAADACGGPGFSLGRRRTRAVAWTPCE